MKDNLDDLYSQLGLVSYNIALHKSILKTLKDSKQELLSKIQNTQLQPEKNSNNK
jgi:hypothetical protein